MDGLLTFHSSAEAERFIHKNPPLRRASAFSWWPVLGNLWGIAINRGGPSFQFCRQQDGQFWAGGQLLERSAMKEPLDEHVNALIGPPAERAKPRVRTERIDYRKTKAPNFGAKGRAKRVKK